MSTPTRFVPGDTVVVRLDRVTHAPTRDFLASLDTADGVGRIVGEVVSDGAIQSWKKDPVGAQVQVQADGAPSGLLVWVPVEAVVVAGCGDQQPTTARGYETSALSAVNGAARSLDPATRSAAYTKALVYATLARLVDAQDARAAEEDRRD